MEPHTLERLERPGLASLIADNQRLSSFLEFLEDIFQIAMARNDSRIAIKSATKLVKCPFAFIQNLIPAQLTVQITTIQRFLYNGLINSPRLKQIRSLVHG